MLKTNAVSSSTPAACATAGRTRKTARDAMPVAARMAAGRRCERIFVSIINSYPPLDTLRSARRGRRRDGLQPGYVIVTRV